MVKATFRFKLMAVFGAALLVLLAVLLVSAAMSVRQGRALDDVQGRLVPRAELGPRIEAELEQLTRGLQDAVAAQDPAALEATIERKAALFELLRRAGPAIEPGAAAGVRWAVQDYYDTARDVSRRMIGGESSERLLQDMSRMQVQQRKAQELIKRTTAVDRRELAAAFASVRDVGARADRLRLAMAGVGVALVFALAYWGGGGMLQAVQRLSAGLFRFGTGDFATPIVIDARDELASVAEQANRMAASLQQLSDARARDHWFKSALSGLAEQLRGELTPDEVAERSLSFLCGQVGALAGALYIRTDGDVLELSASHAGEARVEAATRFARGEGLVGQAARSGELLVIDDPPSDYLKVRSGLGQSTPAQLLLVPLVHFGDTAGVLELALLKPVSPEARELLLAARSHVVIALRAARNGAARQELLAETQAQAQRLVAQEEELRINNQELLAQQEELRLTNQELEQQRLALAKQNDELEGARRVLADKADELNRVSAYKSQFLANMSHELRTPLNSMLLLSHLMAENEAGNLTPKQVEHLRTVHSAGQDLLGLINEVLDLSKIEAGKQDFTLEQVEPAHFVAFVRRLFESAAQHRGLVLDAQVDASAPPVLWTDRQRVERILINLVGNALKFTQRGRISVWLGRPRGAAAAVLSEPAVAFEVSDTGAGVPREDRERIFSPFEQVAGAGAQAPRGTGLGLPIARESARLLGGDIVLDSSSSAGSTFVCVVPERSSGVRAPLPDVARQVEDDAPGLAQEEPYLLIIEDDGVLAEQLVEIAHARKLKVVVVRTGEEGLRRARAHPPLGIILDVRLPDTNGWGVMEQLKRHETTRRIPVHFVSGVDAPQRGLALGAIGYLVKPATHAELADMLRALVPLTDPLRSVLIVEDDADYGRSIAQLLSGDGFDAHHVQTGAAAFEALSRGGFGGMILDLGLPDVDGLSFLRTLRQRPELGAPSVVIHTGRALSKAETRELEAYAEAVVLKDGGSAERLLEEARLFMRHVTHRGNGARTSDPAKVDVSLRGVKLLLAEDDMRTVYSLSALLRGKGADVVTVETGKEALEALSEHPDVRCVLMDIMMPEMDGYEAMRRLRQRAELATLPVIALTAKAMKGERERCIEAGANDYLPKPIEADTLLLAVQRVLGAS